MQVNQIMTREAEIVDPNRPIEVVARLMRADNLGALPVGENDRLVGMITDRDITVRSVAAGQSPDQTCVSDVMSTDVRTCYSNQSVDEVMQEMGNVQIRRVPVIDEQSHRMVGIVSLGDLAMHHEQGVEDTLERISGPGSDTRH